jgi:hypothetical protein
MSIRSQAVKDFYRDHHAAAAGVATQVRDWTGSIATTDSLVIGGPGLGAQVASSAVVPNGTLFEFTTYGVANLVVQNIEAATEVTVLKVADSLAQCITGTGLGVNTLLARVQRYTAAHEAQKVVYNPEATPMAVSITWEETATPGFLNGTHPGNGVVTIPLGTITPSSYSAGTAPLYFRLALGKGWVVTTAKVRSLVPLAPTGTATIALTRSDAVNLSTAPLDLKTLVAGTLTTLPLAGATATRTVSADQYVDIVVDLGTYDGTGGDVMVELEYTLS